MIQINQPDLLPEERRKEVWKEYNKYIEISNYGRGRYTNYGRQFARRKAGSYSYLHIHKISGQQMYTFVYQIEGYIHRKVAIHKAVYQTFIDNEFNHKVKVKILHIDGNPLNNRATNLKREEQENKIKVKPKIINNRNQPILSEQELKEEIWKPLNDRIEVSNMGRGRYTDYGVQFDTRRPQYRLPNRILSILHHKQNKCHVFKNLLEDNRKSFISIPIAVYRSHITPNRTII